MIAKTYDVESTLINHRVPTTLKETFDNVCKFNHRNRTSVLIDLMRSYIDDETPRIERALEQHNVALQWSGITAEQSR
jgi:NAD-dependent oxidoreductase involved in siderophore biosynthesis